MKIHFSSAVAALATFTAFAIVAIAAPFDSYKPNDISLRFSDLQVLPTSRMVAVEAKDAPVEDLTPTVTTPQLQPRADYTIPFQPTYQVLMGKEIQHVGQIKGELLRSEITKALQYLCPDVNAPNREQQACKIDEKYVIKNVEYRTGRNLGTNAILNIWVSSAYLPWNARNDFIETAALAYFRETEDSKNCYTDTFNEDGHAQSHYWCNVGRQVEINTINGYGAHLKVNVAFNGRTDEGIFDCVAIQESVREHMRTNKPHGYYRYTQWYEDHNGYPPNITVEVGCYGQDVSIDTAFDGDPEKTLFDENWEPSEWQDMDYGGIWISGNFP